MKKFIISICSIILFLTVGVLCLSLSLKKDVVNNLFVSNVKDSVINKIVLAIDNVYNLTDGEKKLIVSDLEENKSLNKTINKYTTNTVDYLTNHKKLKDISIKNDMYIILGDSIDLVTKDSKIKLTETKKKKVITEIYEDNDLDGLYTTAMKNTKETLSDEQIIILDLYRILTLETTKTVCLITIGVLILLIALLKKSFYKWLFNIGLVGVLDGSLILGLAFLTKVISDDRFLLTTLINNSIIILTIGIVLLMVYSIIKNVFNKEK